MRGLHRRQLWIAALLAGGLSALALSWALAAPKAGFMHIATNLSQNPSRPSYYADIAVSPDGDRVAVVWPEMESGLRGGSVLLRWASESTGNGWSPPITVFQGSGDAGAVWAAVAVSGTNPYTAYVAYVVHKSNSQQIYYRVCELKAGGSCGPASVITSTQPAPNDPGFGTVDIALDGGGNPHFAYVYYRRDGALGIDIGTVYYKGPFSEEQVSEAFNARRPAIAWNNGAVHIVWETAPTTGGDYFVFHRRRIGTGWNSLNSLVRQGHSYAPHNPAIAVFSNTVMVVWDMNHNCQSPPNPCTQFTLAYIRSTNNGENWPADYGGLMWYEVGGGLRDTSRPYTSTSEQEYEAYLRPFVGFMGDGKPIVVWHVNDGTSESPDYNLYWTRALTVPADAGAAMEWAEIARFGQNTAEEQASPVIAPYLPLSVPHVAYLQSDGGDWETFYDGNEYDRYPHVFLPLIMRNFSSGG